MIRKLLEGGPVKYQIVWCANYLIPKHMVKQKMACVSNFSKILGKMYANN